MIACLAARSPRDLVAPPAAGRVDSFQVAMPELGDRRRTVRVYLPAGYGREGRAFPVLYMQDAQQLFTPGPFGDWKVDETLDALAARGEFAGVIVVGVDNGARRWDEYGPWVNHHMMDWVDSSWSRQAEGGEGAAYLRFLTTTLKPLIDGRYRTLTDREHTGIGGSSMGGLIALYAGLTRPDVFSKVMAMSPAVWFAEDGGAWLSNNRLLGEVRTNRPAPLDVRFYVDVGSDERSRATDPDVADASGRPLTYARAYVEGARAVAVALTDAGVPPSHLRLVVDPGAEHNESAWSRRFAGALRWLYE